MITIAHPQCVWIDASRWKVDIEVLDAVGRRQIYVASADSAIADSGIWFGTKEEYEEVLEEGY